MTRGGEDQHHDPREAGGEGRDHGFHRDLRAQAVAAREGLVHHLEAGVVDGMLEHLVDPLVAHDQPEDGRPRAGEQAGDEEAGRAHELGQGKHEQAGTDAEAGEEGPRDEEAREQAQHLGEAREEAEEGGEGRDVRGVLPRLGQESEVHEVFREHAEEGEGEELPQVGVAQERARASALVCRRAAARRTRRFAAVPGKHPQQQEQTEEERTRGEPEQVGHAEPGHEEGHREGAGDARDHLAGADEAEEPLGLAHVVEASRYRPVLEVGQDRQHAVEDEQGEHEGGRARDGEAHAQACHRDEQEQEHRGHEPAEGQARPRGREEGPRPRVREGGGDVDPGEGRGAETGDEERARRRFEENGREAHGKGVQRHEAGHAAFARLEAERSAPALAHPWSRFKLSARSRLSTRVRSMARAASAIMSSRASTGPCLRPS